MTLKAAALKAHRQIKDCLEQAAWDAVAPILEGFAACLPADAGAEAGGPPSAPDMDHAAALIHLVHGIAFRSTEPQLSNADTIRIARGQAHCEAERWAIDELAARMKRDGRTPDVLRDLEEAAAVAREVGGVDAATAVLRVLELADGLADVVLCSLPDDREVVGPLEQGVLETGQGAVDDDFLSAVGEVAGAVDDLEAVRGAAGRAAAADDPPPAAAINTVAEFVGHCALGGDAEIEKALEEVEDWLSGIEPDEKPLGRVTVEVEGAEPVDAVFKAERCTLAVLDGDGACLARTTPFELVPGKFSTRIEAFDEPED